ncbi:superoxide dismutase, Ni [Candidatus Curtissbacteria bacterium RBG_13_35_7]|uniref:Superoxide dismutase, Ni n=1 Tax=Candidatus Curtissbacteria bacterium RBG_13_35_7 TaxID=1797705 RepID=A0A1F5G2R1_9BACT|nr:MAG: superoxide dismutase, Ni [Candidatus Curtissbacteria bacterium RBG_13_35_7]
MGLIRLIDSIFKPRRVYAHCDVPCGIYDPKTLQIAAKTVKVMVTKLNDLALPTSLDKDDLLTYINSSARMIATKEEHAQKCKEELLILWTDYFKEEHLRAFPKLHETFWKAAKLCSYNKQNIDTTAAEKLVKAVDEIAEIFAKASK